MDRLLRKIRTDLRLSMNGITATSMREKGVSFRMNFGVDLLTLRRIAGRYKPGVKLAEALWKEDVREMKIMATLLCPAGDLTREAADRWGTAVTNQEIREQACRNLFQEVSFAGELVNDWSGDEDESLRTTGYWLYARLCIIRSGATCQVQINELLERAVNDLKSESLLLRQAALNLLKYHGRISQENAEDILLRVSSLKGADTLFGNEMISQLRFEFGYSD